MPEGLRLVVSATEGETAGDSVDPEVSTTRARTGTIKTSIKEIPAKPER